MSYFRKGDPDDDFNRLDREQAKHEAQLPKCDICDQPIQDDYFYLINGDNVCSECLNDHFRKEVDLDA